MSTASVRTVKRTAEQPHRISDFRARLSTFLQNKQMIEALALANDGDKVAGTPGLKVSLLADVVRDGEVDEKGSRFLKLDPPLEIGPSVYPRVKAEFRSGGSSLLVDDVLALLRKGKLTSVVRRHMVHLKLTDEQYASYKTWYEGVYDALPEGAEPPVTSDAEALDEDAFLGLVHANLITEGQYRKCYEENEGSFAFKCLTR